MDESNEGDNRMKIVILDGYTENPGDLSWQGFEELGELKVYDRTLSEDILDRIGDAEVVYTNKTPLSEETIKACPNLKFIGVLATGYDVVDTIAAKSQGIEVTNIPTYGTATVAQYTIALLLELCHQVGLHSESVKNGEWENHIDWCYWKTPQIELANKVMGIIGFGRIGQATANIAMALGMEIVAYDEYQNPLLESDSMHYVSPDELFKRSDVIVLHCPLLPATRGIINKESIQKMKDRVMIINDSRGPLINEKDLREALESGKVAGAAVDVVSTEPIKSDNPLLKAPNIIITPHMAWGTKESRLRLMNIALENLRAFMDGNPINIVNK
jgi:glycerate dehydrogenase